MFKAGDKVVCVDPNDILRRDGKYTIRSSKISGTSLTEYVTLVKVTEGEFYASRFKLQPTFSIRAVMKDIFNDIKGFISQNRNVFYWVAVVALLDHFFFKGAFRERIKGVVESLLKKAEEAVKQ